MKVIIKRLWQPIQQKMNIIMNLHISKNDIMKGRCDDGMQVLNMGGAMGKRDHDDGAWPKFCI